MSTENSKKKKDEMLQIAPSKIENILKVQFQE